MKQDIPLKKTLNKEEIVNTICYCNNENTKNNPLNNYSSMLHDKRVYNTRVVFMFIGLFVCMSFE